MPCFCIMLLIYAQEIPGRGPGRGACSVTCLEQWSLAKLQTVSLQGGGEQSNAHWNARGGHGGSY